MLAPFQPLGIFPFPAGMLLLTDPTTASTHSTADADGVVAAAVDALQQGAHPEVWPHAWQVMQHALAGDIARAIDALRHDQTDVAACNHFVLTGDASSYAQAAASADAAVRAVAALAAFTQGASDALPDAEALPASVTRDVRAVVAANLRLARAAAALEANDPEAAADALDRASTEVESISPIFAAQLLAQRAGLTSDDRVQEQTWRRALALAAQSPLEGLRGELQYGLAVCVHQQAMRLPHRLPEVVRLYQAALQDGLERDTNPELWAQAQVNLGLAYVAMPMSDAGAKLRHAVAIQAFREALNVYTRETHPEAWASTMLNMANAMQYLPSSHPQENLMDAVTAYEELLSVRTRAMDPVGYARILANQGNALAHLGIFQPAVEKLTEAHKLLHWYNEADAAQQILEQLEAINVQLAGAGAE
jgi:tetratricopeptide (TPR) repeat protein